METKIFINPRSKQRKLNVTNFKDEWVYQAHESADNLPHMIEYVKADKYKKALAALKSVSQSSSEDADTLRVFCAGVVDDLNNE